MNRTKAVEVRIQAVFAPSIAPVSANAGAGVKDRASATAAKPANADQGRLYRIGAPQRLAEPVIDWPVAGPAICSRVIVRLEVV